MIADALFGVVSSFLTWLCGVVQAAWTGLPGHATMSSALQWCGLLDEWAPVTEVFVCLEVLLAIGAVSLVIKFGQKIVDWLPFT